MKTYLKDERIRTTRNRFAAHGFYILMWLILLDLFYRQVYLQQHISEYLDIFVIFLIGPFYVAIAFITNGLLLWTINPIKRLLFIIPAGALSAAALQHFLLEKNQSIPQLGKTFIAFLIGLKIFFNASFSVTAKRKG